MYESVYGRQIAFTFLMMASAAFAQQEMHTRWRVTQAQLARRLAPFGIRPTIVHRTRTQVRREGFADAFARETGFKAFGI